MSKFQRKSEFKVKRCVVDFGKAPKIKRDMIPHAKLRKLQKLLRREAI